MNDQSGQQCKLFSIHTALSGVVDTDIWSCGSKSGGVLGDIRGVKISLFAMQMPICQKRPNFIIQFLPLQMPPPVQCRPGRMPPLPPSRCHCPSLCESRNISFHPLRIPTGYRCVLCHSLTNTRFSDGSFSSC